MTAQCIPFPPDQQVLVDRADEVGIGLDFARIATPVGSPAEQAHRRAAVLAVAGFAHRRQRADCGDADPSTIRGRRVDVPDLLGRVADPARWRLLWSSRGYLYGCDDHDLRLSPVIVPDDGWRPDGEGSGPYVWLDGGRPVWLLPDPAGRIFGIADAVLSGPYGPQLPSTELEPFLRDVLGTVLGGPPDDVEAYRWEGDWSPYFDAGREWGQAFVWTVRTDDDHIVAVGRSVTD